jgi:hypothetical protein
VGSEGETHLHPPRADWLRKAEASDFTYRQYRALRT